MGNRDRQKASDIFRNTEFVFSQKLSFKEAFPNIEDISVEVKEYEDFWRKPDDGMSLYPRRRLYNINQPPGEYVDCSNTYCYNGGFSLGSILREMVSKKEISKEGSSSCQGYEGSPKGRRRYRSCVHKFDYKITIKYKEVETT